MLMRVLPLVALIAAVTSSSFCHAQYVTVTDYFPNVHQVGFGENQETLLSVENDTATYSSSKPFWVQSNTLGNPWEFRVNGGAWEPGGPFAPSGVWNVPVDGTSTPSLAFQILGPGNPPSVLASGGDSDTNASLDIDIGDLQVSIPIEDLQEQARSASNVIVGQVANLILSSETAQDFIQLNGLTEQDVANREAQLIAGLRGAFHPLANNSVARLAGISGGKAKVYVAAGNPGIGKFNLHKSAIPGTLDVGNLEFNFSNGNLNEIVTEGIDGVEAFLQTGNAGYILDEIEDVVLVKKRRS